MLHSKRRRHTAVGVVAIGVALVLSGGCSDSIDATSANPQGEADHHTSPPEKPSVAAYAWNQFGRNGTRNPVSPEKNPPLDWQIEDQEAATSRNVIWSTQLGTNTMGDPVVADGLVWVGTNEYVRGKKDASVLLCVSAKTGESLYRYVSPRLPDRGQDWPGSSLACSPLIEGDQMWFTTNRCEVICLDISALRKGTGKPEQVWKVDMIKQFGVHPRGTEMGVVHIASVANYGKFLYAVSGNGVDKDAPDRVPAPDAPSLVCLEKATGKLVWQDASPGADILCGQWSSPAVFEFSGQAQIVVGQGDGWVRAFDPNGDGQGGSRLIWEFDINPKTARFGFHGQGGERRYIVGSPVFHDGRIYVGSGLHPEFAGSVGRLVCIDPTRQGDISEQLAVDAEGNRIPHRRLQAVDLNNGEQAIHNPNSGLVWSFNWNNDKPDQGFQGTACRVAVHNELVIAPDIQGFVHCLDAVTGQHYWTHDVFAAIYASPLIVDGKVYVADEDGVVTVLTHSTSREVIATVEMPSYLYCSPVFANGVLYLATRSRLHAISNADKPDF